MGEPGESPEPSPAQSLEPRVRRKSFALFPQCPAVTTLFGTNHVPIVGWISEQLKLEQCLFKVDQNSVSVLLEGVWGSTQLPGWLLRPQELTISVLQEAWIPEGLCGPCQPVASILDCWMRE